MNQPPRRRPSSSRNTTSRPRKIAGHVPPEADTHVSGDNADPEAPTDTSPTDTDSSDRDSTDRGPASGADPKPSGPGWLASERLTGGLLGALVLVLVAGLTLSGLIIYNAVTDGDSTAEAADVPEGQIAVTDGRPVAINELAWQEGVDAAAKAAQEIVAVNYEEYDAEVDRAAELMTADFAETYRQTAGDVQQQIVERKTVVQASIAAQGVVRANETELQALIFLNQFVNREDEDGPTNVITPYKVLVTMVHTDDGWFVDRLDTDDAAPATGEQPSAPPSTDAPSPTTGE